MIQVFATIDDAAIDNNARLYHENDKVVRSKIIPFLSALQCPQVSSENDEELSSYANEIAAGNPAIIYPILLYCLSNQEMLKERMYLAPFLSHVQLPLDISMGQHGNKLSELSSSYQCLQDTFKKVYNQYIAVKKEEHGMKEKSLHCDLKTIQDEKVQLLDRIRDRENRFRSHSSSPDSFQKLLNATAILRKEQDDDIHLGGRLEEQKRGTVSNRTKLKLLKNRLQSIQALHGHGISENPVESILYGIQREVAEVTMTVRSDLVSERSDLEREIALLKKERDRPLCTKEDLDFLLSTLDDFQKNLDKKSKLLEIEKGKRSQSKISMFQQVRKLYNVLCGSVRCSHFHTLFIHAFYP